MCRQGASVIQKQVLDTIKDPSVRVYVVWVPILATDHSAPDEGTLSLLPDKRASHFWDAKRMLPEQFQTPLGLPTTTPAWDVYLIYPPGVKWGQEPPAPVYWQHQLGRVTNAPRLDGKSFADHLRKGLSQKTVHPQHRPPRKE